jgi:hypothetical protein
MYLANQSLGRCAVSKDMSMSEAFSAASADMNNQDMISIFNPHLLKFGQFLFVQLYFSINTLDLTSKYLTFFMTQWQSWQNSPGR